MISGSAGAARQAAVQAWQFTAKLWDDYYRVAVMARNQPAANLAQDALANAVKRGTAYVQGMAGGVG